MTCLSNHSIDESNCKVAKRKDDKNCGHDKISQIKAYLYLFRSLALNVVLRKGWLYKSPRNIFKAKFKNTTP